MYAAMFDRYGYVKSGDPVDQLNLQTGPIVLIFYSANMYEVRLDVGKIANSYTNQSTEVLSIG